ncbi:MAG: branched-chain amino acid ABC transporter permease, partial [Chthoniobacterales bacterium]
MNLFGKYSAQCVLAAALLGAGVLAYFSTELDPSFVHILIYVGINITLAVSLNFIIGYTGQFSLCHAAFMAIGAYTAASLTKNPASLHFFQTFLGTFLGTNVFFCVALIAGGFMAALGGL